MSHAVLFSQAQIDDAPTLAALEATVTFHPWTAKQYQSAIENGDLSLIIRQDKTIVAWAVVAQVLDEAELHTIATHRQFQGQGLAKQLLEKLFETLKAQSCTRLFLEVRESNAIARHLYQKMGFIENGYRKAYYPTPTGEREAAILMEKAL